LHEAFVTLYSDLFVSVNKSAKGRDIPALGVDGTVFCEILGEGFDKLVDSGEKGDVVFLTTLSKASNRLSMSGMHEFAPDADGLTLEPGMVSRLLCGQALLARIRGRSYPCMLKTYRLPKRGGSYMQSSESWRHFWQVGFALSHRIWNEINDLSPK
jgi:hypothetical protein